MINALPFVGWFLSFFLNVSLAIPFYIIWTLFGIGETYAYWLPEVYLRPGFWSCVGIFMVMRIIKSVFIPKLVSISNDSKSGGKDD